MPEVVGERHARFHRPPRGVGGRIARRAMPWARRMVTRRSRVVRGGMDPQNVVTVVTVVTGGASAPERRAVDRIAAGGRVARLDPPPPRIAARRPRPR